MSVLNHLAQAAAILLICELMVILFIFLAIAGGLAFGLRWARGKTGWAMTRADTGLKTAQTQVHKGTTMAAKPMIVAHGWFATAQGTLLALQSEARRIRGAGQQAPVPTVQAETVAVPPPTGAPGSGPATDETTAIPQVMVTEPQPFTTGAVPVDQDRT